MSYRLVGLGCTVRPSLKKMNNIIVYSFPFLELCTSLPGSYSDIPVWTLVGLVIGVLSPIWLR